MDITITAKISPSPRHDGHGFYVYILVNGEIRQPIHNFRKTQTGARKLANTCANNRAEILRKFGNNVTVVSA